VDIAGNRSNASTPSYHRPTTGLEAKFSMEYAVSILLLDGKATLGSFTDAVVRRPDVQDMLRRSNFQVDPEFNKTEGKGDNLQTVLVENGGITIYMKVGRVISGRTKPAKGSPKNPMTYEEVAEKFRRNGRNSRNGHRRKPNSSSNMLSQWKSYPTSAN
jgi:2-methylcitrate dehydratase PrpD